MLPVIITVLADEKFQGSRVIPPLQHLKPLPWRGMSHDKRSEPANTHRLPPRCTCRPPPSSKLDIITVSRFTIRLPKSLIYPQRGIFRASHLRLAIITSGSYLRFSPNLSHKTLFSHPMSPYFSYICLLPSLSSEFHTPIPVCIDGRVQVSKNLSLY